MRVLSRPTVSLRPDISYQMPFMKLLIKEQIINPETGVLSPAKFKAAFGQRTFLERIRGCVSTRFRDPDIEEIMRACLGRIITPHEDNFSENRYPDRSLRDGFLPMEEPVKEAPPAVEKETPAPVEKRGSKESENKPIIKVLLPSKPAVPRIASTSKDTAAKTDLKVPANTKKPAKKVSLHSRIEDRKPSAIKRTGFIPSITSSVLTLPYEAMSLPPELIIKLPKLIIGKRIEAIRESRGLKKSELANAAGICTSTYAYVENRDSLPNPHQLFAISKVLNVAPESIIYGASFGDIVPTLSEGAKILFLRLRHGWTQQDLADKMGNIVTRSTINYWEQDKTFPEEDILRSLRNALEYGNIHTNSRHVSLGRASEEPKLLAVASRMKRERTVINPGTLSALSGLSLTTARSFLKKHPEYGYSA